LPGSATEALDAQCADTATAGRRASFRGDCSLAAHRRPQRGRRRSGLGERVTMAAGPGRTCGHSAARGWSGASRAPSQVVTRPRSGPRAPRTGRQGIRATGRVATGTRQGGVGTVRVCGRLSPGAQVEAQVECWGAVGEGADGQVVDAGGRYLRGAFEREAAAGLEAHPGWLRERHRGADVGE